MSIDVNVQNDLVIVTESSEDITVNVSNAAGPAGVGVPSGGFTGQVLKKLTNTDYDTYWALDGGGVPYSGATGDVNLGEFQLRAGQVTLDTTPTGTASVATTRWNDTTGVSETTLKGGSVILKNGVDLVARVVNKVTPNATLTKAAYQAVRISGAQGQRLAVALAQANNDTNSADTIGLVTETITTNQEGFIMTMGQLEDINTTGSLQGETWVDGDVLYLSPTTAGAITKVKPTGGGHIVVIGYVEYAHVNNGKIYVKVMNGWELDELHDVSIVSPANNEALIYESSTALWKNKTIATALGYTPISGSGATGQVAYWNGTSSQTGSNNLFWDAANSRLGIGTNSSLLQPLNIYSATSAFINFNTTNLSTSFGGFRFQVAGFDRFTTAYRGSSADLIFSRFSSNGTFQNDTITLYNSTGNVGINSQSDSGQRLQVYGDAFIKGSGATSATNALLVQNSASTNLFVIRNDGNVGIGTTTPANILDVVRNQNASTEINVSNTTSGTASGAGFRFTSDVNSGFASFGKNSSLLTAYKSISAKDMALYNSTIGGDIFLFNDFASGRIRFTTGGVSTPQMTLTAAGRLLLGTTTEGTFLLDVNGTARVSGALKLYSGGTAPFNNYPLNAYASSGGIASFEYATSGYIQFVRAGASAAIISSSYAETYDLVINPGNSGTFLGMCLRPDGIGVKIGGDPTTITHINSAQLNIESTTRGFLPPRMTTTQKNAITTPAAGLQVYDTTLNQMSYYNGTTWVNF